jgi:chemotaxis signal transduction protein
MSTDGRGIDWADVKRRVQDSQHGLERALRVDEERLRAVFRRRAGELAERRGQADGPAAALQVLVCGVGPESYALEVGALVELLPFAACTPVPGAPPALLGVLNVHGEIRSVVDLGRLLDLPPTEDDGAPGYVLVVRHDGHGAALRVDRVDKIQALAPEAISAPGAEAEFRYLRGLTPDRLRVLDLGALLAHPLFGSKAHP